MPVSADKHFNIKGLTLILAGFCGSLVGFSAPGYDLWWLAWVGFIPIFAWLQTSRSWQSVVLYGFIFGLVYHLIYFGWFPGLHPMTWLGFSNTTSLFLVGLGWILLSSVGGLLISGLVFLYWLACQRIGPWITGLLFPWVWIGGFNWFSSGDWYIPWAFLEYTQYQCPFPWLCHPFWILLNNHIGACLVVGIGPLPKLRTNPRHALPLVWLLLFPVVVWITMTLPLQKYLTLPFPVGIIQGNLPIADVRAPSVQVTAKKGAYFSPLQNTDWKAGTLVLMPEEGIVTGWVNENEPLAHPDLQFLQAVVNKQEINLITGLSSFKQGDQTKDITYFNTMAFLSPNQSPAFYHKRDLVPFGEVAPRIPGTPPTWLNELLGWARVPYEFLFSPGTENRTFKIANTSTQLLPTVCFELVSLPWHIQPINDDSVIHINVSNLGWFHQHPLLSAQFFGAAQYKSRLARIPTIIASNSGPSGVINQHGNRVVDSAERIMEQNGIPTILRIDPSTHLPPQ